MQPNHQKLSKCSLSPAEVLKSRSPAWIPERGEGGMLFLGRRRSAVVCLRFSPPHPLAEIVSSPRRPAETGALPVHLMCSSSTALGRDGGMEGWREGEADHIGKLKEDERTAVKTSSCSFALVPLPLFVSPASQITILYMAVVEKNPGCSAPSLLLERWMRGRQGGASCQGEDAEKKKN